MLFYFSFTSVRSYSSLYLPPSSVPPQVSCRNRPPFHLSGVHEVVPEVSFFPRSGCISAMRGLDGPPGKWTVSFDFFPLFFICFHWQASVCVGVYRPSLQAGSLIGRLHTHSTDARERENGERGGGMASTVSRAGISGYEGFCLGAVAGELEKR